MVPLGAYLAFLILWGQSAALTATQDWDLLPYTGLITVVPLLLFGVAAQRTRLSTIGMLQFIAPALQLLVGIMVYGEGVGPSEQVGFGLVWVGATVYAIDTYLSDQPPRNGLETGD